MFTDDHDTVIAVDYDGDLAADARPVLDHDLDNRMIPALATDKTKVSVRSYRRPHYVDHGTVAACPYHDYAHGFDSADASLRWVFANPAANTFFVNIDYANLTGQPVTVKISVGGEELTAPLPVTIAHDRDWRWFRQQLVGSVDVDAGTDQSLAVTVTTPIADTDRIPSHLEDGKPGGDHDGFMIKSITLKSLVPPRYGGESA